MGGVYTSNRAEIYPTERHHFPSTLSLLMTTQEAFEDIVDQEQTAQNVQSDL